MDRQTSDNKGFVALLSVIILGAVGLVVAVSFLVIGNGAELTSSTLEHSASARALASSCAESALLEIKNSGPASYNLNLNIDGDSCSADVSLEADNSLTIRSTGLSHNSTRRIRITITTTTPSISIGSYQDVAGF